MDDFWLSDVNENLLGKLYDWIKNETRFEYFTCRPVGTVPSFDEWMRKTKLSVEKNEMVLKVLIHKTSSETPIGRVKCFDFNPRNKSFEIGFYFPEENRGKGFGKVILGLMLDHMFNASDFEPNKIYATTASNNIPSVKILESCGFHKDGENREHYWIKENRYSQLVYSILRSEWQN
ncbi:GNAT family N-acetyltransferase [bacterium]|nr:GNAT family N-acetyltransferase [bacterium]